MKDLQIKGMKTDSKIVEFYLGKTTDNRGRSIEEIWQWDHELLERTHDYIQWLFPLPEVSRFHPHAPILTEADITRFKSSFGLNTRLTVSLEVILDFYGLSCQYLDTKNFKIIPAANFPIRKKCWLHWGNHNHFRIGQILKSLQVLGLENYAQSLLQCLEQLFILEEGKITKLTLASWQDAVKAH